MTGAADPGGAPRAGLAGDRAVPVPVPVPGGLPLQAPVALAAFDWGGTLMAETGGPAEVPMADWPQVWVLPGAAEALAMLADAGPGMPRVPIALCTNASVSRRPDIERALRRAGLWSAIDTVFCFTDLGVRKDDPRFWQAVAAHHRVPLAQIAMVGDSREADACAPRRCGVQGVWLRPAGHQPTPDDPPAVDDLRDFARAVWVAGPVAGPVAGSVAGSAVGSVAGPTAGSAAGFASVRPRG